MSGFIKPDISALGIQRFTVIGAGFIGKSVIRNLLAKGKDVRVLDRHACPTEFSRKATWIMGNFHDQAALVHALHGATVAYHLVSSTVPGDLHADMALELNQNVVGSLRFFEACQAAGVKRVVFASSSSVYGLQDNLPINETAPTNPISAHGIHKLAVEKYLLLAHHLHGIDARILRIANPYGPEQSIRGRQGFVAIAIGNLLRNTPVALRDTGRLIRDFIFIDDLAEGLVLSGLLSDLPPIINIGTGTGYSLRDVVNLMGDLIGRQVETIPLDSRMNDIPISILDIGLARTTMSFKPSVQLRDGLSKTLTHHGFRC